jgi:hypothetical protein
MDGFAGFVIGLVGLDVNLLLQKYHELLVNV